MHKKSKTLQMFLLVRFCFHPLQYPLQKSNQFFKIQMEHSHSIIDFNVTQKGNLIGHFTTTMFSTNLIFVNIYNILQRHLNSLKYYRNKM